MKRAILTGVVVVASLALAAPAAAATPTERRLQRQITTLQREVNRLKTQVRELDQFDNALTAVTFCGAAITADAFQSTWTTLDQKAGGTPVGPQQTVNDSGACNALRISRSTGAAPTLAPFHALMGLLTFRSMF